MKNISSSFIFLFATVLIFGACKKKDSAITSYAAIGQLHTALRSTPQSFTVTAGTTQTIVGANGIVLNFYPNSFTDAKSNIITSGTVDVQMTEMTRPGQMIANSTTTTSHGQLLQSGGQVHVTATMGGQNVFANKYGVGFPQAAASGTPMQLFYGTGEVYAQSLEVSTIGDWVATDTTKSGQLNGTSQHSSYSSQYSFYYLFDSCTAFTWINCDRFYDGSFANTDITITVPDASFDPTNTQVYLVFPSANATQNFLGVYNKITHSYKAAQLKLPLGMQIEIVALACKNGSYYYFNTGGITPSNGMTINAALAADTKENIVNRMQGL